MKLDVLIFAAHPDDAELSMGGTIIKLSRIGKKVGLIDLSEAELSTRGTIESRYKEAENASKILGLTMRKNLKLPDGKLKYSDEFMLLIVRQIRKYKPQIVFAPYKNDRHPDHVGTSSLVKESIFYSGLEKIETSENEVKQSPFRPAKIYYFMQTYKFNPSFIVDISEVFESKMDSVNAYSSQFFNPKSDEPETFISTKKFSNYLEARACYYGFQIGKEYGEPFYCEEDIEMKVEGLL
ncbi:MAG: bacillithiol biosynthesis deacetylase BshB1 [Melioribacteraceae bacterium]|nr:bacillithiol biosynthesis deacetylase BshB1 [Melioribacteraceae bacterium]MCF8355132.1 bacillithiol biosynthesis deacetylase BshB1 [Melioribacteraceae bacterium]MCF8392391.1 bacillithiol biosynthesis deacetylase BshB1 [Melioribacteraceae bacterium]MCF8417912.1 bacillithiol biosynthesis deacetylase BshB1 [Melioribacteraceae bacterium]